MEYYSRTVLLFYFTHCIRAEFYNYNTLPVAFNVQCVCVCL